MGQAEITKKAKYKVKNGKGTYDIVHFETSQEQVVGLVEALGGKATEQEVREKVDEANQGIGAVERIANDLQTRTQQAEAQIQVNKGAIAAEKKRAEQIEGGLRADINLAKEEIRQLSTETINKLRLQAEANEAKIDGEISRARKAEEDLTAEAGRKVDQGTYSTDIQRIEDKVDLKATVDQLQRTAAEGDRKLGEKASTETMNQSIQAGLENAKAHADKQMKAAKEEAQQKIAQVGVSVADLGNKVSTNTQSIVQIKKDIEGKNSRTQVYDTMQNFIDAAEGLNPKKGDLVFVLENKKAYIYRNEDAVAAALEELRAPDGWELFDDISTEADLTGYAKDEEVQGKVEDLTSKIEGETKRAQGEEVRISGEISKANSGVVKETLDRKREVETLRNNIDAKSQEIKDKIDNNAPTISADEPVGVKPTHHIWIDISGNEQ